MYSPPQQTSKRRLQLRYATEADFEQIPLRDHERENLAEGGLLNATLRHYLREKTLGAMVDGDVVVAIVGYYEPWPGLWEVFIYPSELLPSYGMMFARHLKLILSTIVSQHEPRGLRRIQTCSVDDKLHNRWMRYMGFTKEGTMRRYSPTDQTYNMWSIVIPNGSSS